MPAGNLDQVVPACERNHPGNALTPAAHARPLLSPTADGEVVLECQTELPTKHWDHTAQVGESTAGGEATVGAEHAFSPGRDARCIDWRALHNQLQILRDVTLMSLEEGVVPATGWVDGGRESNLGEIRIKMAPGVRLLCTLRCCARCDCCTDRGATLHPAAVPA